MKEYFRELKLLKHTSLLAFSLLTLVNFVSAQQKVYVIEVEGMIDNGISTYIKRGLEIASQDKNSSAVILHLDTFGGLVDAADEIRKSILDSPLKTIAFIDKNAASAGALIALACDSIYMAPGSSIGAATVVQGTGEKASEKMQSYMRSLMRSTAEENGRNPKVAEAMVDESLSIDGVIEAGKLLSLTAKEAVNLGIADNECGSLNEASILAGINEAEIISVSEQWEEELLRFLSLPVVSSILMLMMLGGLYFELQSPGVGFPGIIAAVGALLFFAPLYIMGLAQSWEIVLFIVGVILLILEIFVIPGFGVAGISGITLIILSLGAALVGNIGFQFPALSQLGSAIWTLSITLIIGIALISSLAKYLPSNPYFKRLVLEDVSANNVADHQSELELLGLIGTAVSPLRPSGTIQIDGKKLTVVSDGEFIDAGTQVEIVSSVGNRIIVTKKA
ncbi:nodulation protein NfeD [bacterium]|nr:MAG: nodulation protein NfeD [bacterium]